MQSMIFIAIYASASEESTIDDFILQLHHDSLAVEEKKGPLFVMFTKPGCSYCKRALPEFLSTAKVFHEEGYDSVRFAIVDVRKTGTKIYKPKYMMKIVPTFFYVSGDVVKKFSGERNAHRFTKFVKYYNAA